jgi:predicted DNA-binding transcriptional regulator YafY
MQELLRMLMLLAGNKRYSRQELEDRFEISDRTVYRHLAAIQQAGFVVNKVEGTYNLCLHTPHARTLQKLLQFAEEEVSILYETLSLTEGTTPLKERLLCKLDTLYDARVLSQAEEKSQLQIIKKLSEAIAGKKQVSLHAYRSSNSESITDRTVEAFEFQSDYSAIWCYDKEDRFCKQFKIARINDVELLPTTWQHEAKHKVPFVDAFHMSAEKPIAFVHAHLSLKAYNLLTEEYPLAENYIKPLNGKYLLDIPVADFNGIGRFVMGLLGDVQVIGPEEFVSFLREKVKKFEVLTGNDS